MNTVMEILLYAILFTLALFIVGALVGEGITRVLKKLIYKL